MDRLLSVKAWDFGVGKRPAYDVAVLSADRPLSRCRRRRRHRRRVSRWRPSGSGLLMGDTRDAWDCFKKPTFTVPLLFDVRRLHSAAADPFLPSRDLAFSSPFAVVHVERDQLHGGRRAARLGGPPAGKGQERRGDVSLEMFHVRNVSCRETPMILDFNWAPAH